LIFAGDDQVSFYASDLKVSATCDGIYYNEETGEMSMIEIKSVGHQVYSPRPAHITQVQVGMGLIRWLAKEDRTLKPLLKIFKEAGVTFKDGKIPMWTATRLLYVQASNYFDMKLFDIPYDKGKVLMKMKKKAMRLFAGDNDKYYNLTKPSELPPEGIEKNACIFCAHIGKCKAQILTDGDTALAEKLNNGRLPAKMPKFKSDKTKAELETMVDAYAGAALSMRDLAAEQKEAKEEVTSYILHNHEGTFKGTHGNKQYSITVREANGRVTFDKKAAAIDGVEIDKYNKTGEPYTVTNVKFEDS